MFQDRRERLYRQYVTDALYTISRGNSALKARWAELDDDFNYQKPVVEESPEEIKARILKKING